MGFRFEICVVTITGFIATGCASTGVLRHADLNEHLLEIDTVVIAPPVVSIEYVAFDSLNERMREEEERIRRSLVNVAESALYDHGYDVVEFDFEQALDEDSEFAFRVELLRHEFGFIRRELRENPNKPEGSMDSFRSSVGSIANSLSEKSGADAIFLMHYNGFQKSTGLIVKDATVALAVGVFTGITLVSPQNGATVELVMIDGTTGNVLWADVRGAAGLNAQATKASMEDLPHDLDVGEDEDVGLEEELEEEQEPSD